MKDSLKFAVYSDIHYDRQGARCLTVQDCEAVERAVHQFAGANGCDFVIFAGDRFLKREPEDEVKTRADWVLYQELSQSRIPHYHLIGNHDWTKNDRKWHTSESLRDCPNLTVMDLPATYLGDGYAIHALPAGVPFDFSLYKTDPTLLNIFVFHDMVKGSFLNDAGTTTIQEGIDAPLIDRTEFDLVYAGDIHVPQILPFRNTIGGYVGSVMQRTLADAGCQRGWLEVTATRTATGWSTVSNFRPTRPFFHRFEFDVDEKTKFHDLKIPEEMLQDTFIEVRLNGSKRDVDRLANDPQWGSYSFFDNARHIEVDRRYVTEVSESVVDMTRSTSVMDDLELYLDSGFVELGTLDRDRIFQTVRDMSERRL